MNTNTRTGRNRKSQISYQSAEAAVEVEGVEPASNFVQENEFGKILRSTFEITVKSKTDKDEKGKPAIKYTNKEEPFKYQTVETVVGALRYMGAKDFPDANIDLLGKALTVKDNDAANASVGEAIAAILKALNAKFKSDAKSSAYQSIVNKYTPLEGEQRDTAVARTINNMVKLTSLTAEEVIDILKAKGGVPTDYTIQDYKETPLRRVKGDEGDEE